MSLNDELRQWANRVPKFDDWRSRRLTVSDNIVRLLARELSASFAYVKSEDLPGIAADLRSAPWRQDRQRHLWHVGLDSETMARVVDMIYIDRKAKP